jgi:hypothetical protein
MVDLPLTYEEFGLNKYSLVDYPTSKYLPCSFNVFSGDINVAYGDLEFVPHHGACSVYCYAAALKEASWNVALLSDSNIPVHIRYFNSAYQSRGSYKSLVKLVSLIGAPMLNDYVRDASKYWVLALLSAQESVTESYHGPSTRCFARNLCKCVTRLLLGYADVDNGKVVFLNGGVANACNYGLIRAVETFQFFFSLCCRVCKEPTLTMDASGYSVCIKCDNTRYIAHNTVSPCVFVLRKMIVDAALESLVFDDFPRFVTRLFHLSMFFFTQMVGDIQSETTYVSLTDHHPLGADSYIVDATFLFTFPVITEDDTYVPDCETCSAARFHVDKFKKQLDYEFYGWDPDGYSDFNDEPVIDEKHVWHPSRFDELLIDDLHELIANPAILNRPTSDGSTMHTYEEYMQRYSPMPAKCHAPHCWCQD